MSSTSNLRFTLQLGLLGLLTAGGCASPGSPKPPSLRLPEKARSLTARRTGNTVTVTWFTPANTTDGQPNRGPLTAQICREGPAQKPPAATVCQRSPVADGTSAATFTLPGALVSGAPQLVAYRVELLNDRGRSAGLTDAAYVATGPAPAPAGLLTATPERAGILLRWPASSSLGTMQITRQTAPAAGVKPQTAVLNPEGQAIGVGTANIDSGGMLDRAARESRLAETPLVYTAQRSAVVNAGGHTLTIFGEPSTPVPVTWHPVFAPPAPTGLTAIGSVSPASIDLSWDAPDDDDLAGYSIYRAEPGKASVRLNQDPQPTPSFRDLTVRPGASYRYTVTAIDRHHNESQPSAAVTEQAPQP